ncbi:hypothetical protein G9C98_003931 [Cotesia typhae]|uniref:PBZ-type domain-containing protein n=1 Tax=Cotesia typhae TaxID=2053667 RepID=A0A8J5RBX0_9HYME|nr:hypothetical protein G9C98_003931 [Cotesia typhae]
MDKKNSDGKRKSRSNNEGPPDKKARIHIENILLPCEDRNNDLSSHSIHNENCPDEAAESSLPVHQSTSIEEATGIRVPTVNTEDKLIECTILIDTNNRPECQHGIHCYRKNPQHKKDYKHTLVRRKRKVYANQIQVLKKGQDDDSDKDSDDSSFEESVDESEYGPSDLDESSEEENDVEDDDSDW